MNKSGKNVVIIPSDNNPPKGYPVKKGFMVSLTIPTTGNSAITYRVLDQTLTQLMKINGKDSIELTPTEVKGAPKTFEILAPGMSQGLQLNFTSYLMVFLDDGVVMKVVICGPGRNILMKIKPTESEEECRVCLRLRRLWSSRSWIVGSNAIVRFRQLLRQSSFHWIINDGVIGRIRR